MLLLNPEVTWIFYYVVHARQTPEVLGPRAPQWPCARPTVAPAPTVAWRPMVAWGRSTLRESRGHVTLYVRARMGAPFKRLESLLNGSLIGQFSFLRSQTTP